MKKIFSFLAFVFVISTILQSCSCLCGDQTKPVGVIQFDSTSNEEIIIGYDWSMVDTIGGFTTIPAGFKSNSNGQYEPLLKENQIKWIEGMLIELQRQFKVKITNYRLIFTNEMSQVYVQIFFEPMVDQNIQKLIKYSDELKSQNETLQSTVNNLIVSNRQIKKEIKELKKPILK